jgi:hypothetical protein
MKQPNAWLALLLSATLLGTLAGCQPSSPGEGKATGQGVQKAQLTPTPSPTPSYPPDFHPGFGEKLPEGGLYQTGTIKHTIQKGQSTAFLADRYLKYTDYYTKNGLKKALVKHNKLASEVLSIGQVLEIPGVRKEPLKATRVKRDKTFDARGIYITQTSAATERVFTLVKELKPLGLNTVVFDVKDMDGLVAYKTNVPLAISTGARREVIRDMGKLISMLHDQGIHVVARQVLFHDKWVAQKQPRLALQSKKGGPWREKGRLVWLDPNNPEVQEYNLAISRELADLGVDEIQYDYIRFPAMGDTQNIAYSFDRSKVRKDEVITGFLKRAHEELKARDVLVSIDLFGVVAWDEGVDVKITGQRMEDLGKYADIISPMVYPSHFYPPFDGFKYPAWEPYYFVNQGVLRTAKKTAGSGAVIRPWLQSFPFMVKGRFNADYVATQIKASYDAGGVGWLLWDAQNQYIVGRQGMARWNTLKATLPPASPSLAAQATSSP